MNFKRILEEFNFIAQCRKYGLSLWQCPSFLFILIGMIIIGSMLATYIIGNRYTEEPRIVALITIFVAAVLLIIGYTILQSFTRIAEASRMKTEFISVVSHQLRNPLSSLKWTIELFLSGRLGRLDEKQVGHFATLKASNDRMIDLVGDLLNVSRIDQGRLELKPEKFSLSQLVQGIISDFQYFALANNVLVKTEWQGEFFVLADSSKVRLVLENLFDNAIRYIKGKGEVIVKISSWKNMAKVNVKDNGVGIPRDEQKYIFQKFFRSQNVLRMQTEGSGLGLYIAKGIIEKSEGKIGFQSKEGEGSTFWFTLPIAKV